MNDPVKLSAALLLSFTLVGSALADDRPPADARPLSQVVAILEQDRFDVITEIDWDDNKWEIEARHDGKWWELDVSSAGEILKRDDTDAEDDVPPAGSLPLSHVLNGVERAHAPARVTEVEFDDNHWEIELHDGNREIELKINPRTGQPKGR